MLLQSTLFCFRPPNYEDLMKQTSFSEQAVRSCSIHNRISTRNDVTEPQINSCSCSRPSTYLESVANGRRVVESGSYIVTNSSALSSSTTTVTIDSNMLYNNTAMPGSNVSHELPLLDCVTDVTARINHPSDVAILNPKMVHEEGLGDETEPPPSYDDLFNKSVQPPNL